MEGSDIVLGRLFREKAFSHLGRNHLSRVLKEARK